MTASEWTTGQEPRSEHLVRRFQSGDDGALNELWVRYLPRLLRWAHSRLPPAGRHLSDTHDLVQNAFVRSLGSLRTLEVRGPNTIYAYFKVVVMNQIRDLARHVRARPAAAPLDGERHAARDPSPLEALVGTELLDLYEDALAGLSEGDQEVIRGSVELGMTDAELAEDLERASADAVRMARGRALVRLAGKMNELSRGAVQAAPRRRSP